MSKHGEQLSQPTDNSPISIIEEVSRVGMPTALKFQTEQTGDTVFQGFTRDHDSWPVAPGTATSVHVEGPVTAGPGEYNAAPPYRAEIVALGTMSPEAAKTAAAGLAAVILEQHSIVNS